MKATGPIERHKFIGISISLSYLCLSTTSIFNLSIYLSYLSNLFLSIHLFKSRSHTVAQANLEFIVW